MSGPPPLCTLSRPYHTRCTTIQHRNTIFGRSVPAGTDGKLSPGASPSHSSCLYYSIIHSTLYTFLYFRYSIRSSRSHHRRHRYTTHTHPLLAQLLLPLLSLFTYLLYSHCNCDLLLSLLRRSRPCCCWSTIVTRSSFSTIDESRLAAQVIHRWYWRASSSFLAKPSRASCAFRRHLPCRDGEFFPLCCDAREGKSESKTPSRRERVNRESHAPCAFFLTTY